MITTLTVLLMSASPTFELEWEAPASCAERPETASLVGEASGRAEVQLKQRDSQWVVTVMFFAPMEGIRRVTVPSCEDAVRTAGLLVQLGSRGGFPARPAAMVSEPTPTKPTVVEPTTPVATGPTPWVFSVGAGGALDIATAPAPEPRIAATFLASHELLGFAADVRVGFAQPVTGQQVVRAFEFQGAACLLPSFGPARIGPCAAASLGSWALGGTSRTLAVGAAGLQVRAGLALTPRLEAVLVAGVRANVVRPALVDDTVFLFTTPLLAGDVQLTLGWRW